MLNPIQEDFNTNNFLFAVAIFLALVLSLFLNLGIHPLYLEEPRRALIALEMLFNKNIIVPTEFGAYYYKKPPLYNWLIIASYKIFNNYAEFSVRFFSTLSFLLMGVLLFFIGKKYVNTTCGIYSALLFLVSIDIYYYFSVLGEIDLFFSLLTLLTFFSIFHFYEQQQYFTLFISTYFFGALGVLTKGLPSVVFLAISLPVFFYYKKDLKKLFTFHHFIGAFVFIMIVGGYFFWYSQYNSIEGFITDLWSQSKERTLLDKSGGTNRSFISHLYLFPLECIKNTLPAALFVIFLFRKDLIFKIKENKLVEFCFYIFISNVLIYWLSPGTRARYVYMLYPLMIVIFLYFYSENRNELFKKIFKVSGLILIGVSVAVAVALPFLPQFKNISNIIFISVLSSLVTTIIFFLYFKSKSAQLMLLIAALVAMRFIFDFTILPLRAGMDQQPQIEKSDAVKIAKLIKDKPLHIYNGTSASHTAIFYLERAISKVVNYEGKNLDDYFIIAESQLQGEDYTVIYNFNSVNEKRLLIKFNR